MKIKKVKKVKKDNYFSWLIAYIDSTHLDKVQAQLAKNPEYDEVEAYIPTVKILKKKFKGKEQFDEVPLLFNYGFFKVPRKYAAHREYLDNLQKNVSCIFGWVKDPMKIRKTNSEYAIDQDDSMIGVATATTEEIKELLKASQNIGAHSSDDLELLKPGDRITLKGYPFDDVEAEFISIDRKKKKVRVNIILFHNKKEVEVSIDNVFFTIYHAHSYDDRLEFTDSLDQRAERKTLDKLFHKTKNSSDGGD